MALEMLGRVPAGFARVGREFVALLTNVGRPAWECCTRLGVKVPKVIDVADIATANPS